MPKAAARRLLPRRLVPRRLLRRRLVPRRLLRRRLAKRLVYKPPCGPNPQGGFVSNNKARLSGGLLLFHE
jgi:hypothetical protein